MQVSCLAAPPPKRGHLSEALDMHDTFLFPRADGGVDAYFIADFRKSPETPYDWTPFQVFRQRVYPCGRRGAIQRLTDERFGDLMEPTVSRLSDGQLHLTCTKGIRSPDGYIIAETRVVIPIPSVLGDAP